VKAAVVSSSRARGFTLIELLVAMLLLALVSVMAYRGLDAMARANERMADVTDRWEAIARFFERFAADVTQPDLRAVRDAAGAGLPAWWARPLVEPAGADAQLEFTRKSAPGAADVRLAYRLRAGKVELMVWPALDRSPVTQPQVYPLLENVTAMRLAYLDGEGRWQPQWPVSGLNEALPRAVSIELALAGIAPVQRVFALP
jgi:general secretion pathway protein J